TKDDLSDALVATLIICCQAAPIVFGLKVPYHPGEWIGYHLLSALSASAIIVLVWLIWRLSRNVAGKNEWASAAIFGVAGIVATLCAAPRLGNFIEDHATRLRRAQEIVATYSAEPVEVRAQGIDLSQRFGKLSQNEEIGRDFGERSILDRYIGREVHRK